MVKRKQSLPTRAKGAVSQGANAVSNSKATVASFIDDTTIDTAKPRTKLDSVHTVTLYSPVRASDSIIDIAEVGLQAAEYENSLLAVLREGVEETSTPSSAEVGLQAAACQSSVSHGGVREDSEEPLAVRLHFSNVQKEFMIGVRALSVEDAKVEVLQQSGNESKGLTLDANKESGSNVIFSGYLDCANETVSGFAYLFKAGYISVKPHLCLDRTDGKDMAKVACRLIIGITQKTFDSSSGLLDATKSIWSRNMVKVMKWLRPDLYTDEAIYGILEKDQSICSSRSSTLLSETGEQETEGRRQQAFDPSLLYEAIRPDQTFPALDENPPGLLANLRPYQRRAAYWMVMREESSKSSMDNGAFTIKKWPFCLEISSLDRRVAFFYNPFCGSFSKTALKSFPNIRGGILADEMGLGKTVELLACILTNPSKSSKSERNKAAESAQEELDRKLKKRKRERIACPCGAMDDDYTGVWVQCDICDVWQHASCVGFGMEYEYKEFFDKRIAASKQDSKSCKRPIIKKQNIGTKRGTTVREERYTVNGNYTCGTCAKLIGGVEVEGICGATLIVCPSSILGQWQEEIARHTKKGALKLIVYEGFQRGTGELIDDQVIGANYGKVVGAHELAMADIVLTTYSTLQADLSHVTDGDDSQQRAMRYIKRYPVVPTPLTRMKWWRVCLDEAQMVESSATRATEMAKRLDAEIRWCITGTPIQRSLDDLHGLFSFLDLQPFCDSFWWTRILKEPYEKNDFGAVNFTHNYLRLFMWRSSKAHVSNELGLPPQEEMLTWLTFSPVEAHFYQRQHDRCAKKALEVTSRSITTKQSSEDRMLTHVEAAKVMHPLLSLRQACCHPQVGSSGLRSLQKLPMTMDEVLKVLIDKAKTEGEEAQRSLVGALNGLAALKILEGDLAVAVNLYREALSVTEENAEDFDVDPLQKLHVLHNLLEALNSLQKSSADVPETPQGSQLSKKRPRDEGVDLTTKKMQRLDGCGETRPTLSTDETNVGIASSERDSFYVSGVPRTLRDSLLEQQCQDISAKYMASFYAKLSASHQDYTNAHLEVCKHLKDLEDMEGGNWWLDALASLPNDSKPAKDLVTKIKASLLERDALALSKRGHENASSLALRFKDINGLKYVLNRELDAIVNLRESLIQKMIEIDDLMKNPTAEQVERAGNCSNCDHTQKGPLCAICEADQVYQMYENRLFMLKSSAANIGEVVSLEDAFTAQQRLLSQKRMNTLKMTAGSHGAPGENRVKEASTSKAIEIANIQVNRSPSETENILKLIKANMKQKMEKDLVVAGAKHLEIFEAMRKEYSQARLLAFSQRTVLLALDELNMAKTRLCLKFPGEEASTTSNEVFKVLLEEIPQRNAQLTGEKFIALDDLRHAKGQVRYLQGLAISRERSKSVQCSTASQFGNKEILSQDGAENSNRRSGAVGGNMEENCPVCQDTLGMQLMVLPCGHMLCCKCLIMLVENDPHTVSHKGRKRVSCPSCRYRTPMDNIAFIDNGLGETPFSITISKLQSKESSEEASIYVGGSYGTKMEAVVRRILRVQASDKNSRFLVFSTWNDVLDVVGHSLSANRVSYIRAKGRRHLNAAIRKFKGTDEPAKVLLLLIQQGANGLNLTEAQHVILVEPLLNPGAEAQAVNRVHRIGQQHATYVHKFLIKDTVEESIFKLSQLKSQSPSRRASLGRKSNQEVSALTVKDLKILFKNVTDTTRSEAVQEAEASRTTSNAVSLRELPPSIAAAAAAEARLRQARNEEPNST